MPCIAANASETPVSGIENDRMRNSDRSIEGCVLLSFVHPEGEQNDQPENDETPGRRRRPADRRGVLDAVDHSEQADDRQHKADRVQLARARILRLRNQP